MPIVQTLRIDKALNPVGQRSSSKDRQSIKLIYGSYLPRRQCPPVTTVDWDISSIKLQTVDATVPVLDQCFVFDVPDLKDFTDGDVMGRIH